VTAWTHDERSPRLLTRIDEFTRECQAIKVSRRLGSQEVIETLADGILVRGVPEHIRSDNGPEFTAKALRASLQTVGGKTLYIEPGNPWENGYCDSFNGPLRDELLNGEIFYNLKEAQIVISHWRRDYNTLQPLARPSDSRRQTVHKRGSTPEHHFRINRNKHGGRVSRMPSTIESKGSGYSK
jgi:putative transposase